MARPISLAALTVLELTPPEMVTCAAAAGFSHVGIRLLPATPTEPRHDIVGDTPLLREVERRLADTGIRVLDVEIFRIKPGTRAGDYEAAIATAARLGASELLVAGNDPEEARLIDGFAAFCDLAGNYGLAANLEFMPWTDARDLTQAARIIELVSRSNAGLLIDAFHFSRSRSRVEDIATVPPSRLRFMQICDVPAAIPPTMDAIVAEARRAAVSRRGLHRPARPAACHSARHSPQRRSADTHAGRDGRGHRACTPRAGSYQARARATRLSRPPGPLPQGPARTSADLPVRALTASASRVSAMSMDSSGVAPTH